jgi:hypothetical protein
VRSGSFKIIGLAVVVAVALAIVAVRLAGKPSAPLAPPAADTPQREAVAACERFVRREVQLPATVTAVRPAVYAVVGGATQVSGSVEINDGAGGPLLRKHYFCSVRRDASQELVLASLRLD